MSYCFDNKLITILPILKIEPYVNRQILGSPTQSASIYSCRLGSPPQYII